MGGLVCLFCAAVMIFNISIFAVDVIWIWLKTGRFKKDQ